MRRFSMKEAVHFGEKSAASSMCGVGVTKKIYNVIIGVGRRYALSIAEGDARI